MAYSADRRPPVGRMMSLTGLAVAVGLAACLGFSLPSYTRLLTDGGLSRPNYQGHAIPVSAGLLPALTATVSASVYGAFGNPLGFVTAGTVLGALVVGLLDDSAGNRDATGLKGHFTALLQGRLSTGALKALIIPIVAFAAAASLDRPTVWVMVDTALMALAANTVNLLDVRPGRAVKGALLLLATAWIGGLTRAAADLWALFTLCLLVYAPWDLRGRAMLGDSGSNAFGLAAGWFCVVALGPVGRLTCTLIFLFVHVLSERTSLSQLIEKSPIFRSIDRWGRE